MENIDLYNSMEIRNDCVYNYSKKKITDEILSVYNDVLEGRL